MEKLFKMMTNAFYPALFLKIMRLMFPERLSRSVNSPVLFLFIISAVGFIGYAIVVCKQSKKDQSGPDKT